MRSDRKGNILIIRGESNRFLLWRSESERLCWMKQKQFNSIKQRRLPVSTEQWRKFFNNVIQSRGKTLHMRMREWQARAFIIDCVSGITTMKCDNKKIEKSIYSIADSLAKTLTFLLRPCPELKLNREQISNGENSCLQVHWLCAVDVQFRVESSWQKLFN